MPANFPVPREQSVESVLASMVTTSAHVARAPVDEPASDTVGMVATWESTGQVAVVAFADHHAVNTVGAAIAGTDAESYAATKDSGTVDATSAAQFREFVAKLAACFNSPFTPEVTLRNVADQPGTVDDDVHQLRGAAHARRSFRITVDDVDEGAVTLYFA
ncbi:MAG TPA: hypothetical protein VFR41_05405 [Acidimicrobiia bacterium]|nr:hypothetical protein [Acidimicrobiia bacterium]